MMRGELVIVIFFVVAIVLVSGFLAVALMFPEFLPWYSGPSQRSSPPVHLLGRVGGLKRERQLTPSS